MKGNVILSSTDRELFGITIRQETKSGFLNLSDLQEAYTVARVENGWSDKRVHDILTSQTNVERLYYIVEDHLSIKTGFTAFMDSVEKKGITKVLKESGVYRTTGARQSKTTWANPYVWVLVALELNPMLYYKTVKWLADNLIINRIEAGNFYKGLTRAVSRFDDVDYVRMAKGLNYAIFGRHEAGIRNTANQQELKDMEDLEKKIAYVVEMGFVSEFKGVLSLLKKEYEKR